MLLVISQEGKRKQRKCLSRSHDESVIKGALPVSSYSGGTLEAATLTPDAPSPPALPLSHQSRPVSLANPRRTSDPTPDPSPGQNLLCWPLLILPQSCSPPPCHQSLPAIPSPTYLITDTNWIFQPSLALKLMLFDTNIEPQVDNEPKGHSILPINHPILIQSTVGAWTTWGSAALTPAQSKVCI